MEKCKECNLYDHELLEGVCPECRREQEREEHLCPECYTFFRKEGEPCSHEKEGLEAVLRAREERLNQGNEEWPITTARNFPSRHVTVFFRYYMMIYEKGCPAALKEEYSQHLSSYIKDQNISKEACSEMVDQYHAMYGC